MKPVQNKFTLVTGVIGDDVHNVGIRILEQALRNAGFKVVSLGIQTSQKEFIDAVIETKADAILISSHSGHAKMLCEGLKEKCIEAGLKDVLLYLGGQLMIGDTRWEDICQMFKQMGFNRICPPITLPGEVIAYLEADLGIKPKSK
jgi:methylaspartate mutase sigma subunit